MPKVPTNGTRPLWHPEHDYLPVSQKENYTRLIPDAQLAVIAGSHHALPAEKPDDFNQTVLNFLAGHPCT